MKNLFVDFTWRSIRSSRMRTAATLIGVVISVAMITGIIFVSSSIYNSIIQDIKNSYGDWSVHVENMDSNFSDKVEAYDLDTGVMKGVAYAYLENRLNPEKPFLYLASMDSRMMDMASVEIVEGRLPKTAGEIVIPEHLMTNGGVRYKIGDTITLKKGTRINTRDGRELTQRDAYHSGSEVYITHSSAEYTVTGICSRISVEPYMAAGYTAIVAPQESVLHIEDSYFASDDYNEISRLMNHYYIPMTSVELNEQLLSAQGKIAGESTAGLLVKAALALVVFAGICGFILMYNTFTFSLQERKRQYRILRSVGATGYQLRKASVYEGVFLGAVGIPAGIIAGLAGTVLLLYISGDQIAGVFIPGSVPHPELQISADLILMAVLISLIMLLFSIIIPAYRTGRTKAVESSSEDENGDDMVRALRRYPLFSEEKGGGRNRAGIEMKLARKNFRKDRKMYRYAILSMSISMVLFISAGAMGQHIADMIDLVAGDNRGYDISYSGSVSADAERAFMLFSDVEGVYDAGLVKHCSFAAGDKNDENRLMYDIYIVDDDTFGEYLDENGVAREGYFDSDSPKALLFSGDRIYGYIESMEIGEETAKKFGNSDEEVNGNNEGYTGEGRIEGYIGKNRKTITIGKYITELKGGYYMNPAGRFMILSESGAEDLLYGVKESELSGTAFFRAYDAEKAYTAMAEICESKGLPEDMLTDMKTEREELKGMLFAVRFSSNLFIFLITIIAMTNLFNTMSSMIEQRRFEFATLLSVGMSRASLIKMILFESIFLGLRTLAFAAPASFIAIMIISGNLGAAESVIPWNSVLISVLLLFAVCTSIMGYGIYKMKKKDPAETLKMTDTR